MLHAYRKTVLASLLVAIPVGLISSSSLALAAPAFPGAEGFGANSIGGRGGTVIEVTNLNNSGPGSLRAAVEASGPRIVVFRVSGTIILKTGLTILNPYITIAGQTAPGGGITLRNDRSNGAPTLDIRTHDVIIRYIRMRTGPGGDDSLLIYTSPAYNVMIDHISASWGVDENVNIWGNVRDVTIQWSIISEGLKNSTHPEGDPGGHSMGFLVGSGSRNISFHHNVLAHNDARNPKWDGSHEQAVYDFVNNVIYNWGAYATAVSGNAKTNVVGNYYKRGSDSSGYTSLGRREVIRWQDDPGWSLLIEGNVGPTCPVDKDLHPPLKALGEQQNSQRQARGRQEGSRSPWPELQSQQVHCVPPDPEQKEVCPDEEERE